MRAIDNPESAPFVNSKKKGKRKNSDIRSANFANNRRNARQMPARQLQRGR
ncbi:hypothetical protein [Actinomadura latina]|uniref:hypothetical protein n=1 Tax=Actinomadura latina TaxID=163603 RepID=UPI000B03BB38|nr:hypothetical protein [Actinomadura latina]